MNNTPCPRCGCLDGKHVGFHDRYELPIKKGDRVRVRAGAEIRTTLPNPDQKNLVNKRTRTVTVFDIDPGRSDISGYTDTGQPIYKHVDDPGICWAGTGGYWHYAKLTDVEIIEVSTQ